MSEGLLRVIEPYYCGIMDPDMTFGTSTSQDLTMAAGGITSYLNVASPQYSGVPISACPHCAHSVLFVFLFHRSTTYLLLLEAPGVWDHCRSSFRKAMPCLFLMAKGKG